MVGGAVLFVQVCASVCEWDC